MAAKDQFEIELKLGLTELCTNLGAVLEKLGSVTNTRVEQLENIYFDTKDKKLFALGAGLRIRRAPSFAEQTLKLRGTALGGIHQRSEFNVSIDKRLKVPDLSRFPVEAFAADNIDTAALQSELCMQCAINFKRISYDFSYQGCEFEISIDDGHIEADGVEAPISELEIELKKGVEDKTAVISYFDAILQHLAASGVPLTLEPFSKMHRAALLMGFAPRNVLELPETPAGDIGTYLRMNLKTFETLLGLFLVKLDPVYLGYMAYTLKCVRRSCKCLVELAAADESVSCSESFKLLKKERKPICCTLKKLGTYLKEMEADVLQQQLMGTEPKLEVYAGKLRRRISKLQAFCLPLHLRALILRLESVKLTNQKA